MVLVFACIAPHGSEVIPELAGKSLEDFAETRKGMEKLALLMEKQKPETIVLATPHGLRLESKIGVITSEFTEGTLEENNKMIRLRCECNSKLARLILKNAKKSNLPVLGANYGTDTGPNSCMPMDWGTLIPLWFFTRKGKAKLKVVIVTPSRDLPFQTLIKFGYILAETVENFKERVAFVASADQGHAHKADGPYGFHQASAEFDRMVREAVIKNDLKTLFSLSKKFIEDAKPDSLWQLAILEGVLEHVPLKGQLISYQAPTYFGMLCAAYLPEINLQISTKHLFKNV